MIHRALRRIDLWTGRSIDETRVVYGALKGRAPKGAVIDVGAHHGSSAWPFARAGWEVVAIEPDDESLERLRARLSRFEHVRIERAAVSDRVESRPLFASDISTGITSLLPFHGTHHESRLLTTTTLRELLRPMALQGVDVLKVDTEGFDLPVLRGFPWERFSPLVVVCEFEDQKTRYLDYNFHDLAQFLAQRGYRVTVSEWHPIVRYGGRHRWRRACEYPCDLVDQSAWGNLIATLDPSLHRKIVEALNA